MTKAELESLMSSVAGVVREYVAEAAASISARIGAIEERFNGLPKPEKGEPGIDGKDGAAGRDGEPGKPGADGVNGKDGRDGVDGKDGRDGIDGKDGAAGLAGKDGASVVLEDVLPTLEAGVVKWMAEVERRANDRFEAKLAEFRQPKDGLDGLSIEDLEVSHDDDGNVTFKFSRGEVSREFVVPIPRVRDKGVYREDGAYRKGDGVTANGSWWIAQVDEPKGRPGTPEAEGQWRLAVKSGRNGKDAVAITAPGPVRLR